MSVTQVAIPAYNAACPTALSFPAPMKEPAARYSRLFNSFWLT